jgi:hypothetical protein
LLIFFVVLFVDDLMNIGVINGLHLFINKRVKYKKSESLSISIQQPGGDKEGRTGLLCGQKEDLESKKLKILMKI